MHYKNGRLAKEGDSVVTIANIGSGHRALAGTVHQLHPKADRCNGVLVVPVIGGNVSTSVTLGECLHAEDVIGPVDIEERAGRMYEAYCAAVGGVAFNGDPLPKWPEFRADPFKTKQSDAWIVAAKA